MGNTGEKHAVGAAPDLFHRAKTATVGFRADPTLISQLDVLAAHRGVDRSAVVLDLINKGLMQSTLQDMLVEARAKMTEAGGNANAGVIFASLEKIEGRLAVIENDVQMLFRKGSARV